MVIALIVSHFLNGRHIRRDETIVESLTTQATNRQINQLQKTNQTITSASDSNTTSIPQSAVASVATINAITITNLEQWRTIIKELQYSDKFGDNSGGWESWIMEQTNRDAGIPVLLENKRQTVIYNVRFIDVDAAQSAGKVQKVEMHSPIMNIEETREIGLKLCSLLELDPKDFSAWCDQVGNHWLDAPLYSSKGNNHLGFETLMAYDDNKPWFINFVIVNRP